MNAPLSPAILLDLVRRAKEQRAAEETFYAFVKQAWPVVEPGVEFVDNWHIKIICEHLQAITENELRFLLINIPPRHAKSTLVSVMWPCWEWIRSPQEKYLCASYSGILSTRDNLKARRLVQSPWYQERWSDHFHLSGDQNQKTRFENDHTGYRIASSVGGTATGEGGSRLLLDDPHGAQDAQSDAMRGAAIEWFDQVWSTRMNDPKRDAMVTIMQRLHEDDVSGRILELGGWEHVCLPAEYEVPKKRSTTVIFKEGYDPRKQPGSLLWPERFGEQELKNLKAQLGEYGTAGQLQQRPAPAGGGILKTKHFQLWPKDRELPVFDYIVQSYDGAYDDNSMSDNDPTACTVWGCFTWKGEAGAMLLDAWDEHLGYPAFRKKVLEDWKSPYGRREGRKGRRADVVLMENKSAGISILQDLRDANIPAIPYNPGKNSKIMRAHAVAPVHELDCVYVLESSAEPGEFVQWARPFIEQVGKFPNATHDDYVDTYTQALHLLRDQGRFEQLPIHEEPPPEELPYRKKKGNPYAS